MTLYSYHNPPVLVLMSGVSSQIVCGEAKVVPVCRMSLRLTVALLLPAAIRAGFYDCTNGVQCSSTYGPPTVGSKDDIEASCDADANCVAFQHNSGQTYGVSMRPFPHSVPPQ